MAGSPLRAAVFDSLPHRAPVLDWQPAARRRGSPRTLDAQLARFDAAIAAFPPAVRGELADLLGLLASAPGRLTFAGLASDWPQASVAELQAMLEGWRFSSLALRQQAYHALRELTNAAYYADPQAWAALGYPVPTWSDMIALPDPIADGLATRLRFTGGTPHAAPAVHRM